MLENYNIRTDLALETRERFVSDHVEIPGVSVEETYDEEREIRTTRVVVETENGAKMMGKPVGTYLTIEAPNMAVPDEDYHREISKKLAEDIKELVPERKEEVSVLVVGLGNREVTPDALGPYVADHLHVTRHIVKEYGKYAMGKDQIYLVSAVVPGVTGQTGMETLEIVKGVVEETEPDFVVAIDALAARNSKRLNRTIQITDTGICPGSGVGNHRLALNSETLGVKVIGIGVPTVVDAVTIVNDTMENFIVALESSELLKSVGETLRSYNEAEKQELIRELIAPHLNGMYMTPKNIDDTIKRVSFTISEALNILFSEGTAS
ncbi:GPR endopeptidase [Faecalimonas umbilicata]|jgi:spore protease|uniref:GPR endopeptidase n=1 Tax=Faecalimonas umbilicata TaxID=1912855 RepID=UPI0022E0529C|nr:GPR endopeptidase [Faecalimonas umbilicata]